MIIGIEFEIIREYTNLLWEILKCIDITKYHWYIVENQDEVWDKRQNCVFFDNFHYNGNDFKNKIILDHYVVFSKIQAYFPKNSFNEIKTYNDFINGNCQMLVLISDCEYIEIYCKDEKILETIYKHVIFKKCKNVNYITDLNRCRVDFSIV